jgi:hypothetical protein
MQEKRMELNGGKRKAKKEIYIFCAMTLCLTAAGKRS